ncbi:hypothetical protein TCDM_00503 [Trypanosoma cruzi Dm28c]|uniref:Uncharacterized protein n=1 Tax=Trypanosoma cruzi Dm28c TaxID=1416333 RepID=V5BWX6_TRYCR|nr:hypothetical protein TCDM_00503 [Trypanosoma cruzi Dm28c]
MSLCGKEGGDVCIRFPFFSFFSLLSLFVCQREKGEVGEGGERIFLHVAVLSWTKAAVCVCGDIYICDLKLNLHFPLFYSAVAVHVTTMVTRRGRCSDVDPFFFCLCVCVSPFLLHSIFLLLLLYSLLMFFFLVLLFLLFISLLFDFFAGFVCFHMRFSLQ